MPIERRIIAFFSIERRIIRFHTKYDIQSNPITQFQHWIRALYACTKVVIGTTKYQLTPTT